MVDWANIEIFIKTPGENGENDSGHNDKNGISKAYCWVCNSNLQGVKTCSRIQSNGSEIVHPTTVIINTVMLIN